MSPESKRSLLLVALLQAAIAATALLSSPTAVAAAAAVGLLAVGRYAAMTFFAATLGSAKKTLLRALAGSAWILGLAALAAAIAATALKARPALPWAVAAAIAGPFGLSVSALGWGIRSLATRGAAQATALGAGTAIGGELR